MVDGVVRSISGRLAPLLLTELLSSVSESDANRITNLILRDADCQAPNSTGANHFVLAVLEFLYAFCLRVSARNAFRFALPIESETRLTILEFHGTLAAL